MKSTFRLTGGDGLPWAINRIIDNAGLDTAFGALRGPIALNADWRVISEFVIDHRLIGMCSRGVFPGREPSLDALHGLDSTAAIGRPYPYVEKCEGFAHCFRNPERYLPTGLPATLLSESDFKDPEWVWKVGCHGTVAPKTWDIIFVCGRGMYHEVTKNASLGMSTIGRVCSELGFRALVVGCSAANYIDPGRGSVDVVDELPWHELMECLARSKSALFPNHMDPSPRLLAEALCLDVPVLVNRDILGGWKYVNSDTGSFFDTEADAVEWSRLMHVNSYHPRAWFSANYGPTRAGQRLAEFLASLG